MRPRYDLFVSLVTAGTMVECIHGSLGFSRLLDVVNVIQDANIQTMINQGNEPVAKMVGDYLEFQFRGGKKPFWLVFADEGPQG